MCSSVHLWFQDNDIYFGEEVPSKQSQDAEEDSKHVSSHSEWTSADKVQGEETHPGDHVHHEAKGDTLGFVVICWEVFSHVAKTEAEGAEQKDISQLQHRAWCQSVAALQDDWVFVEVKILRRLRGVKGLAESRD